MLQSPIMWKPARALRVSAEDQGWLEDLVRSGKTPQRVVLRAALSWARPPGARITRWPGNWISRPTLLRWRLRYVDAGVAGLLKDAPRPGRKKRIRPEKVEAIVNATLHTPPPDATHWSVRTLAKRQRVSPATVHRIWQAHNLQPHRTETFTFSRDPEFVSKLGDVVGLYVKPPAHALVLSVDEKSQIQALDRTQPLLPLHPGVPARQTHDYRRHGTTTLCAALNVLEGHVIGRCQPRHTHAEFLTFLETSISRPRAARPSISSFITTARISIRRSRRGSPPTPAFSSTFPLHPDRGLVAQSGGAVFAEITRMRLRRGTFRSVPALIAAIRAYVREHNKDPRPFIWTASIKHPAQDPPLYTSVRDRTR
jgi:Homeodomain-like domain